MTTRQTIGSKNFGTLRERAERFSGSPRMQAAIQAALGDPRGQMRVLRDPATFFAGLGARIPAGLTIEVQARSQFKPAGGMPFVLDFSSCRTSWVRTCDSHKPPKCTTRRESVCLFLRMYPTPMPPIARVQV